MNTIFSVLIGDEGVCEETNPLAVSRQPTNLPYQRKPLLPLSGQEAALTIFQEQQKQLTVTQEQMGSLIQRNVQLETENKQLIRLLEENHEHVIYQCIKKIFNAIKLSEGFAERLDKRLQTKKPIYLHTIMATIEELLKQDLKPAEFEEEKEGWEWISPGKKEELQKELANYRNTMNLLGASLEQKMTGEQLEVLLSEIAEMSLDPNKAKEAQSRLNTVMGYVGTGALGTIKVLFFISKKIIKLSVKASFLALIAKNPVSLLLWLLG